jgi:pyruvate formate lyase activating enzyme
VTKRNAPCPVSVSAQAAGIRQPLILQIQGNSLDDGPGIRSVVFFKGCPLSCIWCHNPEGKRLGRELAFEQELCVGCDSCLRVCHRHALSRDRATFIDRDKCDLCFACTKVCPSGALEQVGHLVRVEEALREILKDKPFFDTSGGGVTLSGGEPTLFIDYASRLLQALKTAGVHTLLETCGLFSWEAFERRMLPYLDAIYFDLKLMDSDSHERLCGVPNNVILANFQKLQARAVRDGFELLPRTPLVPAITATETNVTALACFLRENGVKRATLLSYNPLWQKKAEKIGLEESPMPYELPRTWMPHEQTARWKAIFHTAGIATD